MTVLRHDCRALATGAIAVVVSLMLGCTHVAVRDLADGRYALTAVASSGGYSGSREEAVEQANEFCARSHHRAVIDRFEDFPAIGPGGEHTSSAVFTCAPAPVLHF